MREHGGLIAALLMGGGLLVLAALAWQNRRREARARAVVADAIADAEACRPAAKRDIRLTSTDRELFRLIDTYRATHSTGEDHL